jgi:hypothetical protein
LNDPRWLDDAIGALREQPRGAEPEASATRARVLASLRAEQRRRSRLLFVALPIAATFLFSTAWAASTGRLQTLVTQLETSLGPGPATVPLATSPGRTAPSMAPARAALPTSVNDPSTDSAAVPATPPPSAEVPAPVGPSPAAASVPAGAPTAALAGAPTAEPAVVAVDPPAAMGAKSAELGPRVDAPAASATRRDESDALYRVAHEAHFVEQNPQKALGAWDAYLAAPGGRFTTEARYNRALTLIRLGRRSEAKAALRSFAAGRPGSYRQHEAEQLIEALGGG